MTLNISPELAELIGIILGEGHISTNKHRIGFTGNKITYFNYYDYLSKLLYKEWNKQPTKNMKSKGLRLTFGSKDVYYILTEDFEIPPEKERGEVALIPPEISTNWTLSKHCI